MTDHRDIVAAFLDHEPVDAAALDRALADANGREYLIDLLVLRGLVANPAARLGPIDRPAASERARERGTGRRSALWLAAAAALVVVGTTGGYVAGRVVYRQHQVSQAQPRVSGPAAPAPTHVIRLENGVTWSEKSGGN